MRIIIRKLGCYNYHTVLKAMQAFTSQRNSSTTDEIWCCEHLPVFTQGVAGNDKNLLCIGNIPVIRTDRGGQVTYHGPGQLVVYCLIDIRRLKFTINDFLEILEESVINLLLIYGIQAFTILDAPGVYIKDDRGYAKLAFLGLRIKQGCVYHGISLNINMDLEPFMRIIPCGIPGLRVTQLNDLGIKKDVRFVLEEFLPILINRFGIYRNE